MKANQVRLLPEALRKIGFALGGTHWQADVARLIDYSKSMITRALLPEGDKNARRPDDLFVDSLRVVMIDKIESVAVLLDTPGLSFADAPDTRKAQKMIADGLKLLRAQRPAPRGKR